MQTADPVNLSYRQHEQNFDQFAQGGGKEDVAKAWLRADTVGSWRFQRMYSLAEELLLSFPKARWLTVGDGRYGGDAHYLQQFHIEVMATDISDVLLKEGQSLGYIKAYQKENAEALSFPDASFDFVFCKEAYHHFPRPMKALYEMLRVARTGVLLIEPNDLNIPDRADRFLVRCLLRAAKILLRRSSPDHHFEEVGNYCYTLSRREVEKCALGMGLRTVAFKGVNDHYVKGVEFERLDGRSQVLFKEVKRHIRIRNALCTLGLIDYQILASIIFKSDPSPEVVSRLEKAGYHVRPLPANPYLVSQGL